MKKFLPYLLATLAFIAPRAEAYDQLIPVVRTFSFSCTTTAAVIVPTTGRNSIKTMRLWNNSTAPVYLGGSDVNTSTTGYPICTNQAVCESANFVIEAGTVVWCKAGSTVVIEVAPPGVWKKPSTRVTLPTATLEFLTDMNDASVSGASVTDYSGHSRTATLQASPASATGTILQSRTFVSASSQYMDLSTIPGAPIAVGQGNFTYCGHVKFSGAGTYFFASNRSASGKGFYFAVNDTGLSASFGCVDFSSIDGIVLTGNLKDGAYHDVCYTVVRGADATARLTGYLDGIAGSTPLDISSCGTTDPNNGEFTYWGRFTGGFGSVASATMDEPAAWSVALSAAQISWIHNLRLAGIPLRTEMGL